MTSIFDSATFLDATTTEALVKRPPVPAGTELIGILGEPKGRAGEKDGKSWTAVDFPVEVDLSAYPDIAKLVNTQTVLFKLGIMLDTNEGGMIDWSTGKNGRLRKVREALGMNVAGQPFSIRAMQGRPIRFVVTHREYEGEIFDEIGAVAKA
jgi:hypothetical protein